MLTKNDLPAEGTVTVWYTDIFGTDDIITNRVSRVRGFLIDSDKINRIEVW